MDLKVSKAAAPSKPNENKPSSRQDPLNAVQCSESCRECMPDSGAPSEQGLPTLNPKQDFFLSKWLQVKSLLGKLNHPP